MPRLQYMRQLRSIKRSFLYDEKLLGMEDSTCLFYVALWFACDDHGFFPFDTRALAAQLSRWRSQEVVKHLRTLREAGVIRLSASGRVGVVVSWHHQHIRDKSPSKYKTEDIQWDTDFRVPSNRPRRVVESRVEESRGEYTTQASDIGVQAPEEKSKNAASPVAPSEPTPSPEVQAELIPDQKKPDPETQPKKKHVTKSAAPPTRTNEVIAAYAEAFKERYGTNPPVQGKTAGTLKRLTADLGADRMIELVRTFVAMNDQWFLTKQHSVDVFESNLNKIVVKADTGNQLTRKDIQNVEKQEFFDQQLRDIQAGRI